MNQVVLLGLRTTDHFLPVIQALPEFYTNSVPKTVVRHIGHLGVKAGRQSFTPVRTQKAFKKTVLSCKKYVKESDQNQSTKDLVFFFV